jgi:hypothetical protein
MCRPGRPEEFYFALGSLAAGIRPDPPYANLLVARRRMP